MEIYVAVYTNKDQVTDEMYSEIFNLTGLNKENSQIRIFNNKQNHLFLSDEASSYHPFTSLNRNFKFAIIFVDFPLRSESEYVLCWIAKLLEDMGEESQVFIRIGDDNFEQKNRKINLFFLKKYFADRATRISDKWVSIHWSKNSGDFKNFKTVYRYFHGRFSIFNDIYREIFALNNLNAEEEQKANNRIVGTYIYSLFGAYHKSLVTLKIIEDHFPDQKPLNILDMGGGYGFLGAELAMKGHNVTVTDGSSFHVRIGKKLLQHCELDKKINFFEQKIEDVDTNQKNQYDIVSYFGCLLYAIRKKVPAILKSSMKILKPGGVLMIHENHNRLIKPESVDYPICFSSEELLNLLAKHAGQPRLYDIFSLQPSKWYSEKKSLGFIKRKLIDWELLNSRVIMATVRK